MAPLAPKQRLDRMLGTPREGGGLSNGAKVALFFAVLVLFGLLFALLEPAPTLRYVRAGFLSGSETGNYYAVVNRIAAEVRRRKGNLRNLASAGSAENVERLAAAATRCDVQFALVQDGIRWPAGETLELIGRLPRPETLLFLGRDADRMTSVKDLRGARLGIGPVGSGTEQLMRRIITPLSELDLTISTPAIDQQLSQLQRGELDLGAMVIDEDARLVDEAVRERRLQILDTPGVGSIARHLPFLRPGRIEAGHYDLVRQLPPAARHVLHVDTLVVGNGCASRSVIQGLITAISAVYPGFVRHNRELPNLTGLPIAPAARSYFDSDGPDLLGVYAPWALDIMPTSNWIQLFFGLSVLFSAMAFAHRFRLWRIDARRLNIEDEITELFGRGVTVGEIERLQPSERHRTPEARRRLDSLIAQLAALSERSRRQSTSTLVPMGQEMPYRHQESLMADLLLALRMFRERL